MLHVLFLWVICLAYFATILNCIYNILNGIKSLLTHSSEDVNGSGSILIESISIHTDHLNNNQDFREAGNQLARAFAEVIKERGLNVNAKQ
jgi:hypothetical protein